MRKVIKSILWCAGSFFVLCLVFWFCFLYVTKYKVTTCDTVVSPDGVYQLTLQSVGEPDFPFGASEGRLILEKDGNEISKMDFVVHDDGGAITENCWSVFWHNEYVEIMLVGEEQSDEQVRLFFDGKKEVKQLEDVNLKKYKTGRAFRTLPVLLIFSKVSYLIKLIK